MKFAAKSYNITHLTLGMLLHYLVKLQIQIFCRYSADMEENANSLQFKELTHLRNSFVNLFAGYPFKYKLFINILFSSLNSMLIVDKHCSNVSCDEFPVPQIDRKSN